MIKSKPRVSVETLRKDKEALGRFLTEDPKVMRILENCIRAGNLKGRVTKEEIISHLYIEIATKEKNWLNHEMDDVYSYLATVVKRMLFMNKYSQRAFLKEEYGFDHRIDANATSFDEVKDDERKLEERLAVDKEDAPKTDYSALLEQFKAIIQIIWEKNPISGELMYRKYVQQEELRSISDDLFRRGLINSIDAEHAYLSVVNRRLPAARDLFDKIALSMRFKIRFEKKKTQSS